MVECEKWLTIPDKRNNSFKYYTWNKRKKKNPIKCGCIIFNKDLDKIVLVQNRYMYDVGINKWGLPKGHLEKDESLSICASRETNEETGLDLKILDSMYKIKINNTFYFPIKININSYNAYLLPKDLKEIKCAKWFSIDSINVLVNRETRIFLANKIKHVVDKLKHLDQ